MDQKRIAKMDTNLPGATYIIARLVDGHVGYAMQQ
jgi:hypothetical protein